MQHSVVNLHRRLGRVLVAAALLSVVFALIFGLRFPWGGTAEAMATAIFGCWFLICLLLAVRAIRRGEVVKHRRWMIRAFATGVAVGTIRIWIGLLLATGLLNFHDSFAAAFLDCLQPARARGRMVDPYHSAKSG